MADVGDVAIQGSDTEANYGRITAAARGGRRARSADGRRSAATTRSATRSAGGWSRWASSTSSTSTRTPTSSTSWAAPASPARASCGGSRSCRSSGPSPRSASGTSTPEVDGLRELGGRWATSLDVLERGAGDVVRETVPGGAALYVSIDLDVLDSSVAPGHSLPGARRAQLPAAARDAGRGGATRARDRLRRRRAQSGARPLRGDGAGGHLDRHALPERDLRPATLSGAPWVVPRGVAAGARCAIVARCARSWSRICISASAFSAMCCVTLRCSGRCSTRSTASSGWCCSATSSNFWKGERWRRWRPLSLCCGQSARGSVGSGRSFSCRATTMRHSCARGLARRGPR